MRKLICNLYANTPYTNTRHKWQALVSDLDLDSALVASCHFAKFLCHLASDINWKPADCQPTSLTSGLPTTLADHLLSLALNINIAGLTWLWSCWLKDIYISMCYHPSFTCVV